MAVGRFAALSERRNSLRIQDRQSETAATKIKLAHYPVVPFIPLRFNPPFIIPSIALKVQKAS